MTKTKTRRPLVYEPLLTPAEVAEMFSVGHRAVWQWAEDGKLRTVRTPGGHRRYLRADVEAHLAASRKERTP